MLQTLDIVIAYTVIMTVLSLLITIIVQMVSAALSLRGKNLANALSLTLQTIDPKIGEHAQALTARILKDPIFSGSISTPKFREAIDPKLQAIIEAEKVLLERKRAVDANPEADAVQEDHAREMAVVAGICATDLLRKWKDAKRALASAMTDAKNAGVTIPVDPVEAAQEIIDAERALLEVRSELAEFETALRRAQTGLDEARESAKKAESPATAKAVIFAQDSLNVAKQNLARNEDYLALQQKLPNAVATVSKATESAKEGGVRIVEDTAAAAKAIIDAEQNLSRAKRELARRYDDRKLQKKAAAAETALQKAKENAGVIVAGIPKQWSFWDLKAGHFAAAIRPSEVYRILHEFSSLSGTEAAAAGIPKELIKQASDLLSALGVPDGPAQEAKQKLKAVVEIANIFTTDAQKKAVVDSLADFNSTVERATTQAYDRFQRWFGSAQDRAEQWFQVHTRIITIVSSVAIAIVLQLDTVEIFRKLRDQPALTKSLVDNAAPRVLEEGALILDPSDSAAKYTYLIWLHKHPLFPLVSPPEEGPEAAYIAAIRLRLKGGPSTKYLEESFKKAFKNEAKASGSAQKPEGDAVVAAYQKWAVEFPAFKLEKEPIAKDAKLASVMKAILEKVAAAAVTDPQTKEAPNAKVAESWVSEFADLRGAGVMAFERSRQESFGALKDELDKAGFDLIPRQWLRWPDDTFVGWCGHILGVLITAGLLTLGAPFWFNLLKNLMSLRPAVATLVERRPQSAPALPSAPAPGRSATS